MKLVAPLMAVALLAGHAAIAQAPPADVDQKVGQMQEQMRLMQSQMRRLNDTRDPNERQRLLEEHGATMQKMMASMEGACMPMHQMMMDQMMQHQHAMMQTPQAPSAKKE
jgi:TolA-binding protein